MTSPHRPILLLTDLDDSLFQTERRCPPDTPLQPAAWDRNGLPRSFHLPAQAALVEVLSHGALLVPVTGRNRDALDRTVFRDAPFAITSFGGEIHTPAGPDDEWGRRAEPHDLAALDDLARCADAIIRRRRMMLRSSLVFDCARPQYLSVKADQPADEAVVILVDELRARGALPQAWASFQTDRSLAIGPGHLGKRQAVRHFIDTVAPPHRCTIGLGDGVADAGFLAVCDFAMTPRGSTLHAALTGTTTA